MTDKNLNLVDVVAEWLYNFRHKILRVPKAREWQEIRDNPEYMSIPTCRAEARELLVLTPLEAIRELACFIRGTMCFGTNMMRMDKLIALCTVEPEPDYLMHVSNLFLKESSIEELLVKSLEMICDSVGHTERLEDVDPIKRVINEVRGRIKYNPAPELNDLRDTIRKTILKYHTHIGKIYLKDLMDDTLDRIMAEINKRKETT